MTEVERVRVEVRRQYRASPEQLFHAWTTGPILARFMTPGRLDAAVVTADVRVGGRYHIDMFGPNGEVYPHDGEYLVVDPPRRLSFTWVSNACPAELASVVTIDFHPNDQGTELVLVHEGAPPNEAPGRDHRLGWTTILEQIGTILQDE